MNLFRHIKQYQFYIGIACTVLIITILLPTRGKFKYEYQRGRPWMYKTLVAPMDIPLLKTPSELRAEYDAVASRYLSYYVLDETVKEKQLKSFSESFQIGQDSTRGEILKGLLDIVYEKGVLDQVEDTSGYQIVMVQKRKITDKIPISEVFTVKSAIDYVERAISSNFHNEITSGTLAANCLDNFIVPNLKYDKKSTELFHRRAVDFISPTKGVIYTGQIIVEEGEPVSAEIEQFLDSYRAEYELSIGYSGNYYILKLGHLLIALCTVFIFIITLYFLKKDILKMRASRHFMLLQLIMVVLITVVIGNIDQYYLYYVPYSILAIYLASFYAHRIVLPIYTILLIPILFIAQNGFELFFLNLVAGAVCTYSFRYFDRGWLQFLNSIIVFGAMSIGYIALRLIEDGSFSSVNSVIFIYILVNAVLLIATYPFLFILERVFGLVSNPRLRDMADTNSPLLREFSEKAPGSFQHSLQVANLSEKAANAIGAYGLLARVGALYHDIGKMMNPQCFIENQPNGATNIHSLISPIESAKQIIRHVDDGVTIAKKRGVPPIVTDFITTHHGRSQTLYFYNKYVNEGGDPANLADFTYHGDLPVYKEQVIVMMADAVEASSRSLSDYSEESITKLVDKVISERMSNEQLKNAEISIKEINRVKEVLITMLLQVYHSRIAYPERIK